MGVSEKNKQLLYFREEGGFFFFPFAVLEKGYQSLKEHLQKSFLSICLSYLKIKTPQILNFPLVATQHATNGGKLFI